MLCDASFSAVEYYGELRVLTLRLLMGFDMDWILRKDESLYFYPIGHNVKGVHKVEFTLPGSYNLTATDVSMNGVDTVMLERHDEDFDGHSQVVVFHANDSVYSMIEFLEKNNVNTHDAIYKAVYEWACKHLSPLI